MHAPTHLAWLVDTGGRLTTADGREIEIWELQHTDDAVVLSEWAMHFANTIATMNCWTG